MSAAVAAYREAVEALAVRVSRTAGALRAGAECDDLAQEGLIQVWQSLERGVAPSAHLLRLRMIDYVRWLGLQNGQGRGCIDDEDGQVIPCPDHVSYDTLLPLDDFRVGDRG